MRAEDPEWPYAPLWEARLLSWDDQQGAEGQNRVLDGAEIRTMLNMSSIYNRMGEYQKSLKVLIKACSSLRKIADSNIFETNHSNDDRIQANPTGAATNCIVFKGLHP